MIRVAIGVGKEFWDLAVPGRWVDLDLGQRVDLGEGRERLEDETGDWKVRKELPQWRR